MADDEEDDDPPGLPPGTPFYMTPAGVEGLRAELRTLWDQERPKVVEVVSWAAGLGDRSENADYQYGKRRLRQIDARVRFLRKRLERVQVVDPAAQPKRDQVFFGATVTYARSRVRSAEAEGRRRESATQDIPDDAEVTITIVGVDEADAEAGRIAWIAPIARALLGAKRGDTRRVRTPAGIDEIEVIAITYPR